MINRFALISCFLVLSILSAIGQSEDEAVLPMGIDAYGIYLPLYFHDVFIIKHAHVSLSMHEWGNIGPAFSYWGFNYPKSRTYMGVGFQHNRQWRNFQAKIEGGLLLHYEIYHRGGTIGLPSGLNVPYIRLHLGHKLGRFISTGLVLNWIPQSKNITYITNFNGGPVPAGSSRREDFFDAHESMVVFIGFSIR